MLQLWNLVDVVEMLLLLKRCCCSSSVELFEIVNEKENARKEKDE